jgi:hypothetical protein
VILLLVVIVCRINHSVKSNSDNANDAFPGPRLFSFIWGFFPERNPIANALPLLIRFAWWNLGANRI